MTRLHFRTLALLLTFNLVGCGGGGESGGRAERLPVTGTFGGSGFDHASSVDTVTGGFVLAGSTDSTGAGGEDGYLVRTDLQGTRLWEKTYGGAGADRFNSVRRTSDGGLIMAGYTDSAGAGSFDGWVVRTDSAGNKLWEKTFGGINWDGARSIRETDDGGFVIAGSTASSGAGSYDGWLIRIDSAGNKLWEKTYGDISSDNVHSVEITDNGGFILAGASALPGGPHFDAWLVRTDSAGNQLWEKRYGGGVDEVAYSVKQTADGGFVFTGDTTSYGSGGSDVYLVRTDSSGNELWYKAFGEGGLGSWDFGCDIRIAVDGGFVVAGQTSSFGAQAWDAYLLKTDSGGTRLWQEIFGNTGADTAYAIVQSDDGGYALAGDTSATAQPADAMLMLTDAAGKPK